MIWVLLMRLVRFLVSLFVIPKAGDLAFIDTNARCPVCGHCKGKLRAMEVMAQSDKMVACLHTCEDCGARWIDSPVMKAKPGAVFAAPTVGADYLDRSMLNSSVTSKGESIPKMQSGKA